VIIDYATNFYFFFCPDTTNDCICLKGYPYTVFLDSCFSGADALATLLPGVTARALGTINPSITLGTISPTASATALSTLMPSVAITELVASFR